MLKTPEFQRVETLLREFGCNAREARIYVEALTLGPASVQELADHLNQNRVTVYSAVEQLIAMGFMYEGRKGKRRLVAAEDPDVLGRLLQRKRSELDLTQKSIEYVQTLLANVQQHDRSVPTVKLYEGVEGLKNMLDESLSAKGEVLVFTFVDLFSQLLSPRYLENYYARRAKKGIRTRLIFPTGDFGKKLLPKAAGYKMQIRFLPPGVTWKSGIFAWNDVIAIQSFTEGKVTCTMIENADIAFFYREVIYPLCWEQAKA